MDLASGKYRRLDINSDQSESWHSWSSNSRWIAFSSKRGDGLLTRTYFASVDERGEVGKPFGLPQEDPTYYDSLLKTYSVPELVTAPLQFSPRALARAARSSEATTLALPEVSMTRKQQKPAPAEPWSGPQSR